MLAAFFIGVWDVVFNEDHIEQTSRAMKAMSHPLRLKTIAVLGQGEVGVQRYC